MGCPFCNLDRKPLYDGKHILVIFSNPRLMPCHLLVIPKRHVLRLKDLKYPERKELFQVIDIYCDKILEIAGGYTLKNNYMPFLKQSRLKVDHLHIHILPRNLDDDLYKKVLFNDSKLWKTLGKDEYEKFFELLRY